LVGREDELSFLLERWRASQREQSHLVLISGEAGLGKSRLAEELARQLRWQGVCIMTGRCFEFERVLPYQPVAEALRSTVPTIPAAELAEFPTWILTQAARLVPEIIEKAPAAAPSAAPHPEDEWMRLFEGVTRFIVQLVTKRGLLLILENLHWATESTLQLVHYLARHPGGCASPVAGTSRPEAIDRHHPLVILIKLGLTYQSGLDYDRARVALAGTGRAPAERRHGDRGQRPRDRALYPPPRSSGGRAPTGHHPLRSPRRRLRIAAGGLSALEYVFD
jgi:hypothetical protein